MQNLLMFQLVPGNEQFYCMDIYISPTNTMGVEDLCAAWIVCPTGCISIVLADLNVGFRDPRNKCKELIVDLINNINLVDTSRKFVP